MYHNVDYLLQSYFSVLFELAIRLCALLVLSLMQVVFTDMNMSMGIMLKPGGYHVVGGEYGDYVTCAKYVEICHNIL